MQVKSLVVIAAATLSLAAPQISVDPQPTITAGVFIKPIQGSAVVSDPSSALGKRQGVLGFCGAPGASCAESADTDVSAEEIKLTERGGVLGFCGAPGASCAKVTDDGASTDETDLEKRGGVPGFCGAPGASCAKFDDTEALPNAIPDSIDSADKRDDSASSSTTSTAAASASTLSTDSYIHQMVADSMGISGGVSLDAHAAATACVVFSAICGVFGVALMT